jgi:GT2 family glycosyltransferase
LGVTGGRNLAIDAASGDVIVFLDDDALLEGGTDFAFKLLNAFSANSNLAAIAFKSVIGIERCDDPIEFPHTDKSLDRHSSFETFRFIGVGHAVRAKYLREVGQYCEKFFYGMEEFDMARRLMKRGYTIEYRPEFRVQHMKSGDGRLPSKAVIQRMYTNKLAVGWMHLPMRYFLASAAAWFVKTTIDSRSLVVPARAILNFIRNAVAREYLVREPSENVAERIRQLGGKAWR